MNKWITAQLNKVKQAVIPPFDNDTTHIVIQRTTGGSLSSKEDASRAARAMTEGLSTSVHGDLKVNHCYRVSIDNRLISPDADWYKTIHNTWNGGVGPTESIALIQVINFNTSHKMVAIYSKGEINGSVWQGWLPVSNIKVICEVKP